MHINACLLKRQQTVFISTNQQNMIIRRIIHHDTLKGKSIVLLALFSFSRNMLLRSSRCFQLQYQIVRVTYNDRSKFFRYSKCKFAVVRQNLAYYHRGHICKPHVNNVYYQYTFNETLESIVFAIYRIIICWF